MRPFNLLRACFWLLAVLVVVELLATMAVIGTCVWTVGITRTMPIGSCADVRAQIQDVWAELLAAILALLLAGRSGNGPPPPPPGGADGPTNGKGGTAA